MNKRKGMSNTHLTPPYHPKSRAPVTARAAPATTGVIPTTRGSPLRRCGGQGRRYMAGVGGQEGSPTTSFTVFDCILVAPPFAVAFVPLSRRGIGSMAEMEWWRPRCCTTRKIAYNDTHCVSSKGSDDTHLYVIEAPVISET
ncbi:hypothetical protein LXL04_035358 [Taraxacum kok-saghyz]